jgi:hypothetical protein
MTELIKKIILISVLATFFLLQGCKKYPDGPFFSIYSASKRINGDWELVYLYENGHDISGPFRNSTCNSKIHIEIETKRPHDGGFNCEEKIIGVDTCYAFGECGINASGKTFVMRNMYKTNQFPDLGPIFKKDVYPDIVNISWEIRRLTFKDFWLTTEFDNKSYELIFRK